MPNPDTADTSQSLNTPNAQRSVSIGHHDLPLHCPQKSSSLWNSHPRVYLPIEDAPKGQILCPYCGTYYQLKD